MPSSSSAHHKKGELKPIKELFNLAWERVKKVWKPLLILGAIMLGVAVVAGILFAMIVGSSFVFSGAQFNAQMLASGSIAAVVLGLGLLVVSVIYGISMILVVANDDKPLAVGEVINKSLKLFLPALGTMLIGIFLAYGAMFLLVIPGLVVAFLVSLSMYEVVFENKRYVEAIRSSVTMVSAHFWPLVGRVAVLVGLAFLVSIIGSIFAGTGGSDPQPNALGSLLNMVLQTVFSWVMISYYYEVYKDIRAKTDLSELKSINWMWITAIIGWVIGVFMIIAMGTALSRYFNNPAVKQQLELNQDFDSTFNGEEVPALDADAIIDMYGQEMTEEEKQQLRDMIELQNQGADTVSEDEAL